MQDAEALVWSNEVIDIYSNSWGPADDGRTVDGPGPLTEMALATSIREVRVWPYVFAITNFACVVLF